MRKLPPLSAIRCFEIAAQHESFAIAASKLCLSPSAVSYHIRTLESFLGVTLFERQGKKACLTAEGRSYLLQIAQALDIISNATSEIRTASLRARSIYIDITCAPSFANAFLVPRIASFLADHANIEIHLLSKNFTLHSSPARADCRIAYGDTPCPGLISLPIIAEQLTPLCNSSMATSMSGLPSLPQNIPLIHTESRQIGWRDFFRTHSRRLAPDSKFNERSIFFDSSIASLQAARDGLGIALESNILAQRDLASGMLVQPLTQTGITGETYYFIAHESKNFENTIVYAFYRWLSDSAKAPTLQRQPRPEQ